MSDAPCHVLPGWVEVSAAPRARSAVTPAHSAFVADVLRGGAWPLLVTANQIDSLIRAAIAEALEVEL